MFNRFVALCFLVLILYSLLLSVSTANSRITLLLDDIKGPVFEAKTIRVHLTGDYARSGQLSISIAEMTVHNHVWKEISISCLSFKLNQEEILCSDGHLTIPSGFSSQVSLHFIFDHSRLAIDLQPEKKENWQFTLQWNDASWQGKVTIDNGQLGHFAAWLPDGEQQPKVNGGKINGLVRLIGNNAELIKASVDLSVAELAFADQAGLHAGENIMFALKSTIARSAQHHHWQWSGDLYWQEGEVFWQPVYMAGSNHHLRMQGIFDDKTVRLLNSTLKLAGMADFNFSGLISRSDNQLSVLELEANNIALSASFDQIIKPFLRDTAFADMEVNGQGNLALRLRDNTVQSVNLDLNNVNIVDQRERFAFHRINARIPWKADGASIAEVNILNGHVLKIPLGSVRAPFEVNGFDFFLPQLALPMLDGVLKLEGFRATYAEKEWHWEFKGELVPVSMEELTDALQIQQMHGTLSGYIPDVRYDGHSVSVNGVLQLNVFDGSVVIHNLKLIEPMGLVPHLKADIAMRNLDLELLTRTFSFGKIEGRVDIDVRQLELANWKPIHFDARLFSSPGDYSRRISQAAIENISALGGEGAVVAIQRSVLRFFEEFRYSEIGWRCALHFNVCYMGGIESEPQSSYTLIKGGGIPAITVIGYNREVGWQELINRLQRITQESEPIIQ